MGNGMNKVLPGLYVGNYRDSKDQQQLEKHQISHIIAIHDSPRRLLPDKHYLCVMAADTPDQNLSQYFSVCNDFIHAARLREGHVLIHCLAGMSRSVTVAVAYIMTATNLNWKEALKVVRAGRSVANPNVGFQTQLQEFEMYRLGEERRRLRERFPSSALEQTDRTKCMAALDNYLEMLQNKDICEGNCSRGERCPTGVCNMDPTKGLFRRRPSSASTQSRLRMQASASSNSSSTAAASSSGTAASSAQSCPTSPNHSPIARRPLGEPKIPEDEEAHLSPTTSSEAAAYAAAVTASKREQQQLALQQQQQHQRQQQQQQKSPTRSVRGPRTTSSTSTSGRLSSTRLTTSMGGQSTSHDDNERTTLTTYAVSGSAAGNGGGGGGGGLGTGGGGNGGGGNGGGGSGSGSGSGLQRSASTISGLAVRPRSSPSGLYSYTAGSVPSSVHGSRIDLRGDNDKGSAIYLGCSAPRNSSLSLSSRGSSGSSAPPSPSCTPPVSPRHGVRRAASLVKKKR